MKASQQQAIAAVNALVTSGGVPPTNDSLQLFTGAQPANVNTPPSGTRLSTAVQVGTYTTSGVSGSSIQNSMIPASGICYRDSNAAATGTAGYFRIVDFAGNAKFQGSVGTTSSFELQLNTTSIIAGQIITITGQQLLVNGLI